MGFILIHHLIRKVVPTFRGDGIYTDPSPYPKSGAHFSGRWTIPPSKPQYNGGVERANRTFAEDFQDAPKILSDSIGARRFEPKKSRPNLRANIAPIPHCKAAPQWSIYRISQTKAA